jgi:MoxR-like ATPase
VDHHDAAVSRPPAGRPGWLTPWFPWVDAVLRRELRDEATADATDAHVQGLLTAAAALRTPLDVLAGRFGLCSAETVALVLALVPEVSPAYGRVFAELAGDVGRPFPTVDVCVRAVSDAEPLLCRTAPLFASGLVEIVPAVHWLSSGLVLSDPVREFLLGLRSEPPRPRMPGLAAPVETAFTWDDLVLPAATLRRLHELAGAVSEREQVFARLNGSRSVRALFCGVSGTGKTMSASVIAGELGLALCRVDLSTVVSKYVGETERNLEAVFRATEVGDVMLMFDEADALFGKRSVVSDAQDRYANIEVAYLLQRMETYDGVLLLATNLAANMDDAFSRRIHFEIDFPMPDQRARERLWARALPAEAPVDGDVDLDRLARMVPLSGGEIGNAALTAAFLAAHERRPIGMAHLVRAIARQRGRQGKLPTAAEFGEYLHLVSAEIA